MKTSLDQLNIRLDITDHVQIREFEDVGIESIQMTCKTLLDKYYIHMIGVLKRREKQNILYSKYRGCVL